MLDEVAQACKFISNLMRGRCQDSNLVNDFRDCLEGELRRHYEDHWFPEKPQKGSAYRCIRIVDRRMDPLIRQAGSKSGFSEVQLLSLLPNEITMWVDPEDVSYRFGEDGSIGSLLEKKIPSAAYSDESSDSDSSSNSSPTSTPTQEIMAKSCSRESYYHSGGNHLVYYPQMQYVTS